MKTLLETFVEEATRLSREPNSDIRVIISLRNAKACRDCGLYARLWIDEIIRKLEERVRMPR